MKTPINLEGVRERTSEEEEVEDVEIKEEEEDLEAGTIKETIMAAAVVIKINIITMILININNESLYMTNQLKYIL